jgi:multidrug efflux pump subunit AcrA (membrane-fusion protein)
MHPSAPQHRRTLALIAIAGQITETQEFSGHLEAVEHIDIRSRAAGAVADTAGLNPSHKRVSTPIDGRVLKGEVTVGNPIDPASVLTSLVSVDDRAGRHRQTGQGRLR